MLEALSKRLALKTFELKFRSRLRLVVGVFVIAISLTGIRAESKSWSVQKEMERGDSQTESNAKSCCPACLSNGRLPETIRATIG